MAVVVVEEAVHVAELRQMGFDEVEPVLQAVAPVQQNAVFGGELTVCADETQVENRWSDGFRWQMNIIGRNPGHVQPTEQFQHASATPRRVAGTPPHSVLLWAVVPENQSGRQIVKRKRRRKLDQNRP